MTSPTASAATTTYSARDIARWRELGYRPAEDGGFTHRACGLVVQDPDGHERECELGRLRKIGIVPAQNGLPGYLHIPFGCHVTDDPDMHVRDCRARFVP